MWVQGGTASVNATTSCTLNFPSQVNGGDTVAIVYGWAAASDTVTISDGKSNAYTTLNTTSFGGSFWGIACCTGVVGNPTSITLTKTTPTNIRMSADEYSGTLTILGSNAATATNANPFQISLGTTVAASSLVFGAGISISALGINVGTSFSQRESIGSTLLTEDMTLPSTVVATASFITNGNDSYIGFVLAFNVSQPPPFGAPKFAISWTQW